MKPIFITSKQRDEQNKIETKTKSYIVTEFKKILSFGELKHELEKSGRFKKNKLLQIFYEVEQRFNEKSAEVTVETITKEYEEKV